MNARCYRCGWSFTLSREAIVAAVTAADAQGDTFHVEPCPRCKQAIKLPVDQLRRALPPGWTPATEAAPAAEEPAAPAAPAPAAEAGADEAAAAPAAAKGKPRRHHAAHKLE
jgi:hypothetical protein